MKNGAVEITRRQRIQQSLSIVNQEILFAIKNRSNGERITTPEFVARIRQVTKSGLSHFVRGEEGVAWWTQVELYAALAEPMRLERDGEPLTDSQGRLTWVGARPELLEEWCRFRSDGPRFRGQDAGSPESIDSLRENIVIPFSESPEDLEWAPIIDWRLIEIQGYETGSE